MIPTEAIKHNRSSVVQILITNEKGTTITSGTGFFIKDYLISNNHVFFDPNDNPFNGFKININYIEGKEIKTLTFMYADFMSKVVSGSDRNHRDYIIFRNEGFENIKYTPLELSKRDYLPEGNEILLLGYPFGRKFLTVHFGHVSANYYENSVNKIQIDASVNPGNSGGPLLDKNSFEVIGIVTRSITGLIDDFDLLIENINMQINTLQAMREQGLIQMFGVDFIRSLYDSQTQMKVIAENMKRSANVGIGIAYSIKDIREELENLDR